MNARIASKRTALWFGWFFAWAILVLTWLYPGSTGWSRALFLVDIAALYLTSLLLALRRPVWRGFLLGLLTLAALFLCLPGRQYARADLRRSAATCMTSYAGTRYRWGGEGWFGIDCSGLVRRGMIEADLRQGLRTFDPQLVRRGIDLWWHDCSARQLGESYRSVTRQLFTVTSINLTDPARFLPGDMAVTEDGSHVMAYLGNSTWIEAHPDPGKVIMVKVPSQDNPRFQIPVKIVRWTQVDPASE
jgi:hypothetical protein